MKQSKLLNADLERAREVWKKVCCLTFGEKYIEEMEDPDVLKIIAAYGKQEREAAEAERDKLRELLRETKDCIERYRWGKPVKEKVPRWRVADELLVRLDAAPEEKP